MGKLMPLKRAIGIIVLVEGLVSIAFAILMIANIPFVINNLSIDFDINIRHFFIVFGIITIGISVVTIFLAIKFLSNKPNKIIAIIFLVICGIGAFGIISALINMSIQSIIMGIVCIMNVTLLIIYLVKLNKLNRGII